MTSGADRHRVQLAAPHYYYYYYYGCACSTSACAGWACRRRTRIAREGLRAFVRHCGV